MGKRTATLNPNTKKIPFWITPELHSKMKAKAAMENRSYVSVIRELLEQWIDGKLTLR